MYIYKWIYFYGRGRVSFAVALILISVSTFAVWWVSPFYLLFSSIQNILLLSLPPFTPTQFTILKCLISFCPIFCFVMVNVQSILNTGKFLSWNRRNKGTKVNDSSTFSVFSRVFFFFKFSWDRKFVQRFIYVKG